MNDEPNQLGEEMKPCKHCNYVHRKRSGRLKFYVGALQCYVYVGMLLDEIDGWGMKIRHYPGHLRADFDPAPPTCLAPADFICFYKGSCGAVTGKPMCLSPDGFSSEVADIDKIKYVEERIPYDEAMDRNLPLLEDDIDDRWVQAEEYLCPHRGRGRRAPDPPIQHRKHGAKREKGYIDPDPNLMPEHGSAEAQRVRSIVMTRMELLRLRGIPVTPKTIAALGGRADMREKVRFDAGQITGPGNLPSE